MAKDKNKVGEDQPAFENSTGANYKNSEKGPGKEYTVLYRQNSSREIYVGGELLRFEAHKQNPVFPEKFKNGVPASIINHPDFQSAANEFTVIEK